MVSCVLIYQNFWYHMYGNIPCMFDNWANPVDHLLLLKSSVKTRRSNIICNGIVFIKKKNECLFKVTKLIDPFSSEPSKECRLLHSSEPSLSFIKALYGPIEDAPAWPDHRPHFRLKRTFQWRKNSVRKNSSNILPQYWILSFYFTMK